MLRDSACGSTAVQAQVYERLRSLAQHAEFNNYLAYILARGPADARAAGAAAAASAPTSASTEPRDAEAVGVRQAAGLLLKNNLKRLYNSLQPPVQAYINGELLSAIGDDSKLIRSAVAVCITAIVSEAGLRGVFSFASAVPAAFLSCLCFFFCWGYLGVLFFLFFFAQTANPFSSDCALIFPAACVRPLFPSPCDFQFGPSSYRRSCAAWTRRQRSRTARCMRSPPFASSLHHGLGRTRPGRWTLSSPSSSTSSNTRRPLCATWLCTYFQNFFYSSPRRSRRTCRPIGTRSSTRRLIRRPMCGGV